MEKALVVVSRSETCAGTMFICYGEKAWKGRMMAKDPVCGMDVDEAKATDKSEYKGKTYYFCSSGCKKTFEANPETYAEK